MIHERLHGFRGLSPVSPPIYIAIYAYSANLARGLTVTKGILAANVVAGLLTLVMYQLTVMAPHFPFVATMTLAVVLVLARMITSDAPWAPLAGFALSVVMILYGESIIPFSDAGGANFADRLGELQAGRLSCAETYCRGRRRDCKSLPRRFPWEQLGDDSGCRSS